MAIRTGQCDAAIVAGANLLLRPTTSLQFNRLSMLSPEGMCRAFDASGWYPANNVYLLPLFDCAFCALTFHFIYTIHAPM